jgi:HD-like signal output (HDOD) protein
MRRVVFIDDEQHVLDGIRRMLRPHRKAWQMEFFTEGQTALQAIDKNPCDVVVTDIQMPGIDGIAVLTAVNDKHPDTIRIALSGQTDPHLIYKCIEHSHQYLSKPCDADQLIATIECSCNLHDMLSDDRLKALINRMSSVPTVPNSYKRITEQLCAEEVDIHAIGEIINEDLAISMQILKIANSAYFGLARKISTPLEATVYLGADVIHSLVLANSMFSQFSEETEKKFNLAAIWESSLKTYAIAKKIARDQTDDALICSYASTSGLVIDIGTLILCSTLPQEMDKLIAQRKHTGIPMWQLETEHLGYSHMEVGAYIASLWGLPNPIIEAIAYHHCPKRSGSTSFSALTAVHIANAIVHSAANEELTSVDPEYIDEVGVSDSISNWRASYA